MAVEVDAIIMAAGLSRRMGTNKLLLPFPVESEDCGAKGTVLGSSLHRIPYDLFSSVIVVYSDDRVYDIARHFPLVTIKNPHPEEGKSSTIQRGLSQSHARAGVMFFVGDQPLLQEQTIGKLLQAFTQNPQRLIVPSSGGRRGNPVIFPARCRKDLLALRGDEGGKQLFSAYAQSLMSVECGSSEEFIDVDTEEKYRQVLALQRDERSFLD